MKKRILLLSFLMFVTALIPLNARADDFIILQSGVTAQVVEIIDVNAIRVRTADGDALVRLIGVHGRGTDEARRFLSREIMGSIVTLTRDAAIANVGRWNYMYVSIGLRNINGELILSGYASINEAHNRAQLFSQMQMVQDTARGVGLGMWGVELRDPTIGYFGVRVNINTATAAEIVYHLGATQAMANAIVSFRSNSVYQHVSDVAFVPAVTRRFYADNRHRMAVSTNINAATVEEIATLAGISQATARNIVNSRDNQRFTNLEQLVSRGLMTRGQLNNNEPFMSLESIDRIHFSRPNFRANMNLASQTQLTRSGASTAQATTIIAQRNALPLRNLGDLNDFTGQFSVAQINALSDNMRTHTNINTAPRSEIESLFGTNVSTAVVNNIINNRPYTNINQIAQYMTTANFDNISRFIYVNDRPTPNLTNINRASHAQLVAAGFSATNATNIINARPWQRPSAMPTGTVATNMRQHITLRTNINTATSHELFTLDAAMDQETINRIVQERNNQPFGSIAQVEEFFRENGQTALFNRIRNFVIAR